MPTLDSGTRIGRTTFTIMKTSCSDTYVGSWFLVSYSRKRRSIPRRASVPDPMYPLRLEYSLGPFSVHITQGEHIL